MRTVLLALTTVACLSGVTFAQSSQPSPSSRPSQDPKVNSQNASVDPILTQDQLNKLPVNKRKPRITLQNALKIAEGFSRKEKIDLSTYFLLEARMIQYGAGQKAKEPRWFFLWVTATGIGGDIEITVSMEGKASRLASM
jgi:hypothetical protein